MASDRTDRSGVLDRRAVLSCATAGALWAALPACAAAPDRNGRRAVLSLLCDLVVPDTDTPGALAARVPDWVLLALAHGLDGSRRPAGSGSIASAPSRDAPPQTADTLDQVILALDRRAGGAFARLPPAQQNDRLNALDRDAYRPAGPADGAAWRALKSLILTGYYTSEIGGSRELRYALDLGRFKPDEALPPDNRAWSSDWTAVAFG